MSVFGGVVVFSSESGSSFSSSWSRVSNLRLEKTGDEGVLMPGQEFVLSPA